MSDALTCSARGCRQPATVALEWRNPAIHSGERVKTWLACPQHHDHLETFLTRRDFPCRTRNLN